MTPKLSLAPPMPLHMILRHRRVELHLLQAQVAESVGVSAQAVVLWECGRRRMELGKLPRIAQVLKLDARKLCAQGLREFHPAVYAVLFDNGAAIQTNAS